MSRIFTKSLPTLLAAAITASLGCDIAMDDEIVLDDPQALLEEENGGLDMEDEAAMFGEADESLFADSDERDVVDPFADEDAPAPGTADAALDADDPTSDSDTSRRNDLSDDGSVCVAPAVICEAICAGEEEPDVAAGCPIPTCTCDDAKKKAYHIVLGWGQFPGNREIEEWRDWTGRLSLNRGTIIVRRTLAFEKDQDEVLPRTERGHVDFRSKTRPHHDGLLVTIVDPTPELDQPVVLTYTGLNADDASINSDTRTTLEIDVEQVTRDPMRVKMDNLGNLFIALGLKRPSVNADPCAHGFMKGRWHRIAPRRGVLYGKVTGPRGHKIGYMRGVWGARDDGSQVFFGKYINLRGQFRGLFRGNYGDGDFKGRWIHRNGDVGVLGGKYAAGDEASTDAARPLGGVYLGRWAETSCDPSIDAANGN